MVEDRYGSGAAQVISNMIQLGHARVGDLEDAYKFTSNDQQAVNSAAEHINGEGMQNGMENGHVTGKGQNRKISSLAQLHSVLYKLLDHGFITRVRKHTYYSAADTHNEAEIKVKREQFPDGKITGPKAKLRFTTEVNIVKRKWRDDNTSVPGDMFKGTVKKNNMNPNKRQKTNGYQANGVGSHNEGVEFDVSLEVHIAVWLDADLELI